MKKFKRIYIEITNICNKNCSFCSKSNQTKKYMSKEEFEIILRQIKPFTNYIYLHVKGEPLIHPNFKEILKLAEKYGIHVNITTNGTLIQAQKETLKNSKALRQLNISLHSFEDGNKEEYISSILNSITDIKEARDLIVVYRFWALKNNKLTRENQEILDELEKYYHISQDKMNKFNQETNIKIAHDIYINKHELFEWPTLKSTSIEKEGFCYGMINQVAILVDGTVVPCCLDSEGVINLGNIFETPFSQIIHSERAQNIRNSFTQKKVVEELCQKCKYRRHLKRGIIKK